MKCVEVESFKLIPLLWNLLAMLITASSVAYVMYRLNAPAMILFCTTIGAACIPPLIYLELAEKQQSKSSKGIEDV